MHRTSFALLAAAGLAGMTVLASPARASAQEVPRPAPAPAPGARVLYTAPMYQTTQTTYVPQSVAMSGPRQITDWKEGEPVPDGYHVEQRTRRGLVIGGALSFGIPYFFSAFAAAVSADANQGSTNPLWPMWIPGLGPFIQMTQSQTTSSSTATFLLGIDGVAQTAGLIMLFAGITSPRNVLVRNDLAKNDGKVHVQAAPVVGRNMTGVGVVGTF
jgi:hypothetical protein